MDEGTRPALIVLSGGPGGGKSELIGDLSRDPAWVGRLAVVPEAISLARSLSLSPSDKLFQRAMVHVQMALENGFSRALTEDDPRIVLCHRGSLDPLAYWLDRGWPEEEFFACTETTREEHYRRYRAVIHLVTAADGAEEHYLMWPHAHRPERPEDAVRLDRLLEGVWRGHPRYFRLDNAGRDWQAKSLAARAYLAQVVGL
jgi:hypothetical protein